MKQVFTAGSTSALLFVLKLFQLSTVEASSVCDTFDYTMYGEIDKVLPNCSDHGTCVEDGKSDSCKCEDGWTGLSDFINTNGVDCQINETTIKILWGYILVLAAWSQYNGFSSFVHRIQQYLKARNERKLHGKTFPLRKQPTLLACLSFQFICLPFSVAYAILRLGKEDERVGVTFLSTAFFAMAKTGFYLATYYYNPAILRSTIRENKRYLDGEQVVKLLRIFEFWLKGSCMVGFFTGVIPFVTYSNGGVLDKNASAVYIAYFFGLALSVFFLGVQSYIIKIRIHSMLKTAYDASKDKKIKLLEERMVYMQESAMKIGFLYSLIFVSFLLNPYQWNLHDYWHPISWTAFFVLGKNMTTAVVTEHENRRISQFATSQGELVSKNDYDEDDSTMMTMTAFYKPAQ